MVISDSNPRAVVVRPAANLERRRREHCLIGTGLVCRVRGEVFSEYGVKPNPVGSEEDQIQYPDWGAARIESYTFDPEALV